VTNDKRRESRISMTLPVRVQGFEAGGATWEEMTKCQDASAGGAGLTLQRSVKVGQVLLLMLPLPKSFRAYDLTTPSYRTYALVQTAKPEGAGCRIGVAFLGKNPPAGFEKNPAGRFLKERRKAQRQSVALPVRLARKPASGTPEWEQTVLESVSSAGARVRTGLPLAEGEIVEIEEVSGPLRARAEVRTVYRGPDGVLRLGLKFL
jgi:hypothetical protein